MQCHAIPWNTMLQCNTSTMQYHEIIEYTKRCNKIQCNTIQFYKIAYDTFSAGQNCSNPYYPILCWNSRTIFCMKLIEDSFKMIIFEGDRYHILQRGPNEVERAYRSGDSDVSRSKPHICHFLKFLVFPPALYPVGVSLPCWVSELLSHCHFRIWTKRASDLIVSNWDPSDIYHSDDWTKTKRQKDKNQWERPYCDVRAVLHSCKV